jgi:hypothetical protein
MTKQEYEQMKRELRRDYEDKLGALEKLWSVFGPKKAPSIESSNGPSKAWDHQVSKRDAVRAAIKQIQGEFDIHRVREELMHTQPLVSKDIEDNQISAILSYLYGKNEIEQARKKSGKAPARYTNKS